MPSIRERQTSIDDLKAVNGSMSAALKEAREAFAVARANGDIATASKVVERLSEMSETLRVIRSAYGAQDLFLLDFAVDVKQAANSSLITLTIPKGRTFLEVLSRANESMPCIDGALIKNLKEEFNEMTEPVLSEKKLSLEILSLAEARTRGLSIEALGATEIRALDLALAWAAYCVAKDAAPRTSVSFLNVTGFLSVSFQGTLLPGNMDYSAASFLVARYVEDDSALKL